VERRDPRLICVYVLGVAVLATGVVSIPVVSGVQDLGRDALLRVATHWPPAPAQGYPDVAVIALDGRSLRAYGDWPWPRSRYAELTRRLDRAGAKAIAFDIDFSSPRDPGLDADFADAVVTSGRVVLGTYREFQRIEGVGELEIASFPIPELAQGAAMLGSATMPLDPDGAVRRGFRSVALQGSPIPSLARAALAVALEESPPSTEPGTFAIDFRRANPPIPVLSFADVLEDRFDPRDVAGRSVFVGATGPVLQDLWTTPIGPGVPGVVIQAIEHRQHAARHAGTRTLVLASLPYRLLVALAVSLLAFLSASGTPRRRALRCILLAAAVIPAGLATLVFTGLLLDPAAPLFVTALHYLLGLESLRRRIDRRLTERELSLSAIIGVGQLASDPFGARGARTALELLGNLIGARSLALLRLERDGSFRRRPIRWTGAGAALEPSREVASDARRRGRGGAELRSGPGRDDRHRGRAGGPGDARGRADRRPPGGGGARERRQPRQERVPRQHEPRDPHPDDGGDRLHGSPGRSGDADRGPGGVHRADPAQQRSSAPDHQ
jgi:CHASE2 domain-containing sensor protein